MSIAVGISPWNTTPEANAGLNGITPHLSQPGQQTTSLPLLTVRQRPAAHVNTDTSTPSLDPLTPLASTPGDASALATVLSAASTTLDRVKGDTTEAAPLLQSPGFQLLLNVLSSDVLSSDVLGSSEAAASASNTQLSDLLAPSATTDLAITRDPGSVVNPTPYFQKLLGELESTYKTASGSSVGTPPFNPSELDLFLKWLSLNGSASVAASA